MYLFFQFDAVRSILYIPGDVLDHSDTDENGILISASISYRDFECSFYLIITNNGYSLELCA
jgi:hypothetical protein